MSKTKKSFFEYTIDMINILQQFGYSDKEEIEKIIQIWKWFFNGGLCRQIQTYSGFLMVDLYEQEEFLQLFRHFIEIYIVQWKTDINEAYRLVKEKF